MRKILLIPLLVAVAAISAYRQRLFLHDPMGKVLVQGVAVQGARIFINYSNDVLILQPNGSRVIVQEWDHMPGRPDRTSCLRSLACLTVDDHAPKTALGSGNYGPSVTMGDREVSYRDEAGKTVRVILR